MNPALFLKTYQMPIAVSWTGHLLSVDYFLHIDSSGSSLKVPAGLSPSEADVFATLYKIVLISTQGHSFSNESQPNPNGLEKHPNPRALCEMNVTSK